MEQIYEPLYYLRVCVSRELSEEEFELLADILEDHISDAIDDDQVIVHDFYLDSYDRLFTCYLFSLKDHLVNIKDGSYVGDSLSADLDKHMPDDVIWELEASLPDQTVEIDKDTTEAQVFEAVQEQIRKILKG